MYSYIKEDEDNLYKILTPSGSFLCWIMTTIEAKAVCAELNKVKA